MNEISKIERTQEGIIEFAKNYIMANNTLVSKNYDLTKSMVALYNNLFTTETKTGGLAINECSELSIKNAVSFCIENELNVGKNQGYFIPYGKELKFMPSYFGLVKMARDLKKVNIVSNVVRDGEPCDLINRSDGVTLIKHKPSIKCLNNKIIAVYSIATHISSGRVVLTNIMSVEEAKKSWLKSQNGCKVGKEFEHEMLIRTSERRLAKHLINKSDDSLMMTVTDSNGMEIVIDESYLANPVDTEYTIDTNAINEDIQSELEIYKPTEEDVVTVEELKLETINTNTDAPEGAIEIDYNEVKGGKNSNKYKIVPNSFNKQTYTCLVVPIE